MTNMDDSAHNQFITRLQSNINSCETPPLSIEGFRDAAVVVPLVKTESQWELLFTVRSKQLSNHAGQVAFPGGKVDPGETLEQAAKRELMEEVGLDVERVIGTLNSHPSPARFVVTPIVANIQWPQAMTINDAEVEEVFTVPLSSLLKINPRTESRTIKNDTRTIRFYEYEGKMIWGLTGNIVNELLSLLPEIQ